MYSSSFDKFYIITACCQNICSVATTSKKATVSTSTQNSPLSSFDKKKKQLLCFLFFKKKQTRLRFLVLITTENIVTYHNALCFCHPKILHKHCLQFLLGVDQQRELWYAMVFSVALN